MFKVALIPIERTIEDMLHTTKLKISSFGVDCKVIFFNFAHFLHLGIVF